MREIITNDGLREDCEYFCIHEYAGLFRSGCCSASARVVSILSDYSWRAFWHSAQEFQLAADILSSAIAVIRTALNYFLMKELAQEKKCCRRAKRRSRNNTAAAQLKNAVQLRRCALKLW